METMKVLCICQRGNSRSVALAYMFKDMLKHDAIAIGYETAGKDTRSILYQWAEQIIVVDSSLKDAVNDELPEGYKSKFTVWDVGPDRYFLGFHPELLKQYQQYINEPGQIKWT